ncbi:DUF3618 domain-containing protein [Pseudomonas matsuisoli]|uniref:DUF3618 domain-containing protein n=1 Tax=Pseudomonas matsuisoli TaxID=1515666 RepID=A0A917PTW5_9PSED|nr:DUF3618 domain-containing protein [Pseudomonas matsuisoli]GGJ92057.1 hypothetical protein GCM10009304_17310 [Pseudomonas matsuisoli]
MSTQSRIEAESHKDPATLEREIDQQRDSITNLVNALENKLSPGQLLDQALSYTKGHGGEFASNLGQTVKANPVPTLLTTVGLAWMMMGQRQPAPGEGMHLDEKADGVRASAHDARDKVAQASDHLKHKASDARHRMGNAGHQASDALRQQSDRARAGFQHLLQEQPLVLGALGMAIGAMLGAGVPGTRQEDQLMGKASDQLKDRAKHKAQEGYERVAEKGTDAAHELNERMSSHGAPPRQPDNPRPDPLGAAASPNLHS